jgi:hypothetical protein
MMHDYQDVRVLREQDQTPEILRDWRLLRGTLAREERAVRLADFFMVYSPYHDHQFKEDWEAILEGDLLRALQVEPHRVEWGPLREGMAALARLMDRMSLGIGLTRDPETARRAAKIRAFLHEVAFGDNADCPINPRSP